MERRAILAIVLSLLVVVVWSILFAPSPPVETPPPEQEAGKASRIPAGRQEGSAPPVRAVPSRQAGEAHPSPPPSQAALVDVDTGVTQLVLTGLGAGVKAVRLLKYRASLDEGSPPTEIAPAAGTTTVPLHAEFRLGQRATSLAGVYFEPSTSRLVLSEAHPAGEIVFRGQVESGAKVERTYRFRFGSYVFEVSTRIEGEPLTGRAGRGSMTLFWGPGLRQQHEQASRRRRSGTGPRSYVGGKIYHKAPKEVGEAEDIQGAVAWTALSDTYFAAVLIPREPAANGVVVRRVTKDAFEIGLRTPLGGGQASQTVQVYVGPKQQQLLKAAAASLGKLIDLGFFSPLARPMVQLLRLLNGLIHNYGVTIILVTFLIKIIFWPLTQKSYKSMQAMQKLQPKMKELQVIYKDDKQALNRAMMQFYREHKVNPMGGCLPMLLQIPFFFAFYNALLYSFELRHAPFVCWEKELFWVGRGICDLSVYDPSYITPLIMGVSMFVQQKMTPTTGDPTQAKFMQFMPLIFLFFFLKAPSGLVIYWLTNNVLSIAQQLLVNRSRRLEAAKAEAAKG